MYRTTVKGNLIPPAELEEIILIVSKSLLSCILLLFIYFSIQKELKSQGFKGLFLSTFLRFIFLIDVKAP